MSDSFSDLLGGLADAMAESERKYDFEPEFPLTITGLKPPVSEAYLVGHKPVGSWVSVRLASKDDNKTYLGVYIGDIAQRMHMFVDRDTRELCAENSGHNPAMFVPELGRLVWGYESWWGQIESPEQLREISDDDIENVWYVQALKSFENAEATQTT